VEKLSTSQRSPLSPTRWPADAFSAQRCLVFVGSIAAAFALGLVCASIAVLMGGGHAPIRTGRNLQLTSGLLVAQIVAYIPLLATALPLLPFVARRTLEEIGLRRPTVNDVRAAAVGSVAMYVFAEAAALLQKFALHVEGTQQAVRLFGTTHDRTLLWGLIVLAVLIAPVVEEVIFRGFVFNALLRYLNVGLAAVLSGIVFGIAHFDSTALFPLACGGIVLAVVYYRSGSLTASMLTHGAFNALNVALVFATGGKG
jgi:membrane protease YdiL (CAAX protease family)